MCAAKFQIAFVALGLAAFVSTLTLANEVSSSEVERAVLAAAAPPQAQQQGESYQGIYDAFSRLMQNMSNNSLGNVRRLVQRLNNLVGPTPAAPAGAQTQQPAGPPPSPVNVYQQKQQQQQQLQTMDEKTEQILTRLDNVTKSTDQHTLAQLNEDVSRLIGTMNESYLRNIRRVIERVNRVVGQPTPNLQVSFQAGDGSFDDPNQKQPGFPGWDELMVAMDRMQKSLASFVRSSTRLITSGR